MSDTARDTPGAAKHVSSQASEHGELRDQIRAVVAADPAAPRAPHAIDRIADAVTAKVQHSATEAKAEARQARAEVQLLIEERDALAYKLAATEAIERQRDQAMAETERVRQKTAGQAKVIEVLRDSDRAYGREVERLRTEHDSAMNQIMAQRQRAEQAEATLRELVRVDDCRYDEHGYCQADGSVNAGRCVHARAKVLLAALSPAGGTENLAYTARSAQKNFTDPARSRLEDLPDPGPDPYGEPDTTTVHLPEGDS